jgi:hypothetical protein
MKDYNLLMFTRDMDFFKERVSLKKLFPKYSFTSLLNNFLIEDVVMLGNLLSTEFMKLQKQLYAILR